MVDERVLIRLSRQGDQRSFEQLVQLKREKAFRIAFNIVGNEDDAKDIAQQAFIRLWSTIRGFKENSRFDPWFYKIVVNLAIDFHRRERRSAPPAAPVDPTETSGALPSTVLPGADIDVMRAELRKIFNGLAVELAPAQRAVFTLREVEGVTTEDIAKMMSIKMSTVRNHLMQARRTLREALRRRYPEYARGLDE